MNTRNAISEARIIEVIPFHNEDTGETAHLSIIEDALGRFTVYGDRSKAIYDRAGNVIRPALSR